jgi:aminoglycoside phosphotransferase (APT) family kinase protein
MTTSDDLEIIQTIADRYYGARPTIEPITNLNHVVYRLRFAADDKILKLATGDDAVSVRNELMLLEMLASHAIPVPVVEHADADATLVGRPFIVMACAGERTVADWIDKPESAGRSLFTAMGATLGRIHRIQVPHPDGGPALVGPRAVERERDTLVQLADRLRDQGLLSQDETDEFKALPVPAFDGATLCHGDFHAVQCIVNQDRIAAVVDWEAAWSGNPAIDLAMTHAYMDYYCPVGLTRAFFAGYASVRPMPVEYLINSRPVRLAQTLALAGVWLRQDNAANVRRALDLYRAYAQQPM